MLRKSAARKAVFKAFVFFKNTVARVTGDFLFLVF
jgi:hypothetical protein